MCVFLSISAVIPIDTVKRILNPAGNVTAPAEMISRKRSPTSIALSISVSGRITANSSPPHASYNIYTTQHFLKNHG